MHDEQCQEQRDQAELVPRSMIAFRWRDLMVMASGPVAWFAMAGAIALLAVMAT